MPFKVYFSDTSDDLEKLRPVLTEQIQKAGMTPVWLDDTEKQKPDALDIARKKIADSDAFISIVTYKRGWEPPGGDGKSLAEIEFETARKAEKPIAVLMPDEKSPMAMRLRLRALGQPPPDALAQQQFWKEVEKSGTIIHFSDETDLSKQIEQLLQKWTTASAQETQVTAAIPRQKEENFLPGGSAGTALSTTTDEDALIERIATRTAEKVQALEQQQQDELAKQAVKYNDALRLRPGELVFGTPSDGSQYRTDIFVIMPFTAELTTIYKDVMTPLAKELKLTLARGDEFTSPRGVVMDEVWSALNQCRFVIVDISGGNDNVYYELGIAQTLNKPAILITQATKPEDVPFDIRHLRYISYANTSDGAAKLSADLKTAITRLLADLEEEWGNSKA